MSFFSDADNAAFFDPTVWGVVATLNGVDQVNGIFDADYVDVLGTESAGPAFTCAAADIPAASQGDVLDIGADRYKVINVRPDGTGILVLGLQNVD